MWDHDWMTGFFLNRLLSGSVCAPSSTECAKLQPHPSPKAADIQLTAADRYVHMMMASHHDIYDTHIAEDIIYVIDPNGSRKTNEDFVQESKTTH